MAIPSLNVKVGAYIKVLYGPENTFYTIYNLYRTLCPGFIEQ